VSTNSQQESAEDRLSGGGITPDAETYDIETPGAAPGQPAAPAARAVTAAPAASRELTSLMSLAPGYVEEQLKTYLDRGCGQGRQEPQHRPQRPVRHPQVQCPRGVPEKAQERDRPARHLDAGARRRADVSDQPHPEGARQAAALRRQVGHPEELRVQPHLPGLQSPGGHWRASAWSSPSRSC